MPDFDDRNKINMIMPIDFKYNNRRFYSWYVVLILVLIVIFKVKNS